MAPGAGIAIFIVSSLHERQGRYSLPILSLNARPDDDCILTAVFCSLSYLPVTFPTNVAGRGKTKKTPTTA
jgi:hypothetical protein